MSSPREEVIRLAMRIADLRAEIAKLSSLQKDLRLLEVRMDELLGIEPTVPEGNIDDRICQLLQECSPRDFSPEEVAEELQLKLSTTRSTLSRLLRERVT